MKRKAKNKKRFVKLDKIAYFQTVRKFSSVHTSATKSNTEINE